MFEAQIPDRTGLFDGLPQEEIVARYRKNYHLGSDIGIEHVRRHADLEASLANTLIASPAEDRPSAFERAYTELYSSLPWLAGSHSSASESPWCLLMRKGARIYEVGSGAGTLAAYLNRNGFDCTATEITKERGQKKAVPGQEGLRWHQTDGVHLDNFEQAESYDYVLSDQVVEHLHPEDILTHFRTARTLLKPGGSYFVRTPHRRFGPHDLSRVFKLKRPAFMHLHEFNYFEFDFIARECGYTRVLAVTNLGPISRKMGWYKASRAWYFHMKLLDRVEDGICRSDDARGRYRRVARFLLSPSNVWLRLDR